MRLRSLIIKEFQQYGRDRRMLGMTVLAPIIQLTLLGYAANLDVEDLPIAICDQDLSTASQRLTAEIEQSGYFVAAARTVRSAELIPQWTSLLKTYSKLLGVRDFIWLKGQKLDLTLLDNRPAGYKDSRFAQGISLGQNLTASTK